jgi:hypothetical protein
VAIGPAADSIDESTNQGEFFSAPAAPGSGKSAAALNPRDGGAKTRFAPSRPCVGAFPFYIKPIGCFRRRKTPAIRRFHRRFRAMRGFDFRIIRLAASGGKVGRKA